MKDKKKESPCQLALKHFDLHYKSVYDFQWPSIRVALLSRPKHCALINNFASDSKQVGMSLAELGAHDFIWTAREKFVENQLNNASRNTNTAETGVCLLCSLQLVVVVMYYIGNICISQCGHVQLDNLQYAWKNCFNMRNQFPLLHGMDILHSFPFVMWHFYVLFYIF